MVVLALLLGVAIGATDSGSSGRTADPVQPSGQAAPLTASAPPRADADAASCAKVLAELPVNLGKLAPRVVQTRPDSPFVVAWGDPAVVLRCGEDKPAALRPGSQAQFQNAGSLSGPYFDVEADGDANVWTTVDRAAYVSIRVPRDYVAADVVVPLAAAIAKALPQQVCEPDGAAAVPVEKLCTRRK